MRVSLIIPALNEAECIGQLLAETPAGLADQVIVVDNGSTDGTAHIAQEAGALVVQEPKRGYGYACAAGAMAADGDVLVYMDGDGSFVPSELPTIVQPILRKEADLVLGSRFLGNLAAGAMPLHQRFGNKLIAWTLSRTYGIMLTDLGPYRAIRRDMLFSLDMQELTYGWTVEMVIKMSRWDQSIVEVPVTYRPRFAGRSKVGGSVRGTILATYRIFRVVLRHAI